MTINELKLTLKNSGVVGAGGAGFPSYAKLSDKADTILLNCAECEPLLKLHRQVMQVYANEILTALDTVRETVGAQRAIVAIKPSYKKAVDAVKALLGNFKNIEIGLLPEVYPAGDEVVTIYETTGRVVPPGKIPIEVGVTVFNVETILNAYYAITKGAGVTHKYITVTGAVKNPITLRVPLGITVKEVIDLAGGPTIKEYALINGGPMTGSIAAESDVITKTSNAILVLPPDQYVIKKRTSNPSISLKRAMSACCQCRMCTDLCSRNLLGHPIEPHAFMRTATTGVTKDVGPFINTMYCSQCGICELYACGQNLSPRTLIGEYKAGLRKSGIKLDPADIKFDKVNESREHRIVPITRLTARLGLTKYNVPAPLVDETIKVKKVKIMLSQNIGVPATATVSKGDVVTVGQVIGEAAEGKLSMPVHASINGKITQVNDKFIIIEA